MSCRVGSLGKEKWPEPSRLEKTWGRFELPAPPPPPSDDGGDRSQWASCLAWKISIAAKSSWLEERGVRDVGTGVVTSPSLPTAMSSELILHFCACLWIFFLLLSFPTHASLSWTKLTLGSPRTAPKDISGELVPISRNSMLKTWERCAHSVFQIPFNLQENYHIALTIKSVLQMRLSKA